MKKFTLKAWAGTDANRAVKFSDPVSGEIYFLELRLPVSYDTTEAVDLNRGVKIVQQLGAGSLILLPDSRPFAGYYNPRQTWQTGQTFTTHAGTRVSIDGITSASASVTVESILSIAGRAIAPVAQPHPPLEARHPPSLRAKGRRMLQKFSRRLCPLDTKHRRCRNGRCDRRLLGRLGIRKGQTWLPDRPSALRSDRGRLLPDIPGRHHPLVARPGAFATSGSIRATWASLNYEKGKLGYPTGKETCGLINGGCYQTFQGGTIHWSPASGAFATSGSIRATWASLSYEKGKLGYPTGKETCGLINGGCYQTFQGGTIHWSPGTGAVATWGGIRGAWGTLLRKRKTRLPHR